MIGIVKIFERVADFLARSLFGIIFIIVMIYYCTKKRGKQ